MSKSKRSGQVWFSGGGLAINDHDENGFQIHRKTVEKSELIRIIGDNHETMNFEYNDKTQISSEVNYAIRNCSVSSFLRENRQYGWDKD